MTLVGNDHEYDLRETMYKHNRPHYLVENFELIADIYISISTETFDIENIKYEKRWQQLDLDPHFET